MGVKANKSVIGNLLAYVSKQCQDSSLTKFLKIVYLIDEEAVRTIGVPVTWLEYEVWQFGPVSTDIYYSRNEDENRFADYISISGSAKSKFCVSPVIEPDLTLFSEVELQIINKVIKEFGNNAPEELVNYTHKAGSLWDIEVKKHAVDFTKQKSSEYTIDFSNLISQQPDKLANYYYSLESMEFQASMN